jgi:hypothetical protein
VHQVARRSARKVHDWLPGTTAVTSAPIDSAAFSPLAPSYSRLRQAPAMTVMPVCSSVGSCGNSLIGSVVLSAEQGPFKARVKDLCRQCCWTAAWFSHWRCRGSRPIKPPQLELVLRGWSSREDGSEVVLGILACTAQGGGA